MGQVPLKRVRGLALATTILVLVTAAMSIVDLIVRQTVTDEADQYLAGVTDKQEFLQSILGYVMVGLVQAILQLAAAVITIVWMYRVASNHKALHRGGTWGPGWAIGGWFCPPIVYVIPTLVLGEMWKKSDPDVPVGGDWRRTPTSPLPIVWVLLYTAGPIISLASSSSGGVLDQFGGSEETIAKGITGSQTADVIVAIITIAAAIVFALFVRRLTERHVQLTGEASR